MRIGLLTQWYPPEPGPASLPGHLARELSARGHDVQVVTGFPNYPSGRLADGYRMSRAEDEFVDGVGVRRVALYPSHDSSVRGRLLNYTSFGASALFNGMASLRGVDALWVNYSPVTVAPAMWASRLAWRVPVVTHVLDLWPDTMLAAGFGVTGGAGRALEHGLSAWCRAMYRTSAAVAYISPSVGRELQRRGVPRSKLVYAPMWADESRSRPTDDGMRTELGLGPENIVLLYAGTLGEAQGLGSLVDACAAVNDPRYVCLIAGSGVSESSLRTRAVAAGATNVRFLGRVAAHRMPALMGVADLSYVSLRDHPLSSMTMPSKTQASMAAGRAILAAAPGDTAEVVRSSGAGLTASPEDPLSIATALREACRIGRHALADMGRRGRSYYDEVFALSQGVDRIEETLVSVVRTGRPSNGAW